MPKLPPPFSNQSTSDWIVQLQQSDVAVERLQALQAVGSLCPPDESARWAAHAIHDTDPTIRALAAKLLGNVGNSASNETETQLLALLVDNDPDVRFESSRALIRRKTVQQDRAVTVLLAFLDEDETQALMAAAVVNALVEADLCRRITEEELRPRILRLLDHERAEVREAVANAFARWPGMSESCTDQLLPLLDDCEPIVREKIAETLGQAGIVSDSIISGLRSAVQDEDTEVARVATEALRRLGSQ